MSDLDHCLGLIRPEMSDESKFIGLTLMSDLLQSSQDLETMTRFFENMDFAFMDRMMLIEDDAVPKDAGVDAKAIRSIALDIMNCFSSHWQLLVRNEFKERVPTMLSILSASDDTGNSEKILDVMLRVSTYPQIAMILTNPGYQGTIVSFIFDTFESKGKSHEDAIQICKRTFLVIKDGYKQNPAAVLQITSGFLPTIMTMIAKRFGNPSETHKAEILKLLSESMAYLPEAYVQQHVKQHGTKTREWTKFLKSGLIQLLSTRQGILLQRLGPEWLFPDMTASYSATQSPPPKHKSPATLVSSIESLSLSESEISKKFVALVVHLTCVEVRVLMDELADDLSAQPAAQDSADSSIQAKKVRMEQVLPLAYEILEVTIGYLVNIVENEGSVDQGLFNATGLLKLQESLGGAFAAIVDYLKDLQFSASGRPEKLASNMIYLASLRILSAWLAEDDSFHGQVADIVAKLEEVVQYCEFKGKTSLLKVLQPTLERFYSLDLV
ncbi:hypothetical protein BGW38_002311 [Lunasporangiospora selenospora]|uniref:Uncharacterized protein n=1 Tax=Lunasporangiospora selenospora TaxID=979761 RepID=A0A9P6KIA7_9FUNG|nr:hypothetical protein BGW38_002311 [Lunasporangiospora selenospora]